MTSDLPRLGPGDLEARRQAALPLCNAVQAAYRHLGASFSPTEVLWLFADAKGHLLRVLGEARLVEQAAALGIAEGVRLHVQDAGSNALGSALDRLAPVEVIGQEHAWPGLHQAFGYGVPLRNSAGALAGALALYSWVPAAITCYSKWLLAAVARCVEQDLAGAALEKRAGTLGAFVQALLDGFAEGGVAVDDQGRIVGCNDPAAAVLSLNVRTSRGRRLTECLGKGHPLGFLTAGGIGPFSATVTVSRTSGLRVQGRAEPVFAEQDAVGRLIWLRSTWASEPEKTGNAGQRFLFEALIGEHPRFKEAVQLAQVAARSDLTVLILGDSGTGKEVFAQAIHQASSRGRRPFVAVNCSAIPQNLITSELFGYVEGAFTGAARGGSRGKFLAADQGTIFLDEIGDMPLESQAVLLRVLQERAVTPVGANAAVPVNVRIIAATNKDLQDLVSRGLFRLDLYFRLCAFTIPLPPLRERASDIPLLVSHLLPSLCLRRGMPVPDMDDQALALLQDYHWPGNVRELQNTLDRAIHLVTDGVIRPEHLPERIAGRHGSASVQPGGADLERARILNALSRCGWNRGHAATALGISRRTFYRRLSEYGLNPRELGNQH